MAVSVQPISLPLYKSEPSSALHLEYRPDVDGLRAIAVLAVIVFHAFPGLLPGGFVGVDVFFVISGFLISGIILRGLSRGRFSVLEFYGRRIKRIFPALIVMLAGVWILGRAMLLADEFQRLGKHVYSGAGFMFNLTLFMDTKPYFGAITSPLIHLWSLGVEEQFYLFWPLFLLATWKLGEKTVWRDGNHCSGLFYSECCRCFLARSGRLLPALEPPLGTGAGWSTSLYPDQQSWAA